MIICYAKSYKIVQAFQSVANIHTNKAHLSKEQIDAKGNTNHLVHLLEETLDELRG